MLNMFNVNNKETRTTTLVDFWQYKAPLHFECIQKYVFWEKQKK